MSEWMKEGMNKGCMKGWMKEWMRNYQWIPVVLPILATALYFINAISFLICLLNFLDGNVAMFQICYIFNPMLYNCTYSMVKIRLTLYDAANIFLLMLQDENIRRQYISHYKGRVNACTACTACTADENIRRQYISLYKRQMNACTMYNFHKKVVDQILVRHKYKFPP